MTQMLIFLGKISDFEDPGGPGCGAGRASWERHGGILEPLGAILRASGGGLRPAVGASWGVVGGVLGASAVVLERPWAAQGGVSKMFIFLRESADFANPERVPKRSQRRLGVVSEASYLSGESWVGLGGVAGRLKTALLASWATLLRQQ